MADKKSPGEEERGIDEEEEMRKTSPRVQERSVQEESLLFGKRARLVLAFLGGAFTIGIPLGVVAEREYERGLKKGREELRVTYEKLQVARNIGNANASTATEVAKMLEESHIMFTQLSRLTNAAIDECRRDSLARSKLSSDVEEEK